MKYVLEYSYPLISILIVASAVIFRQPLLFVVLFIVSLLTLLQKRRQNFLLVLFCFLSFYGSYSLFNIEPMLAPIEIKVGKDIIWLFLLALILPLLNWHDFIKYSPRMPRISALIFVLYIFAHSLFVNDSWVERVLELRNYLEYLPLLFLPLLLLKKENEILQKSLIGFCLIGLFVAALTLSQDKIPNLSMLGTYRANSTLPNYFHLGIFLNVLILISSSLLVLRLRKVFNWFWLILTLTLLSILTFSSLSTDSRGLTIALLISWVGLIVFFLKNWRRAWIIIIPGMIAFLVFFTVGPNWARSRYQDFFLQVTSPLLVSKVVNQEQLNNESGQTPSIDLPSDLGSASISAPVISTSSTGLEKTGNEQTIIEEKEIKQVLKGSALLYEERGFIASHSQDRSLVIRLLNINDSVEMIKKSPFFGQGLLLKNNDPNTAYATDFFFLDVLVQLGLVGAVLFFGLIISVLGRCVIVYRKTKDLQQKILLAAFVWVIILYLLSSLTTSSWIAFPVNALFWLFAGIGLYLTLPDQGESFEKSAKK